MLVCHFFVPRVKQAVKVVTGVLMLASGLALAIAILQDHRADAAGQALLVSFGGAMTAVGALALAGTRPRAHRSQQYVLAWLEQVTAASSTTSGTDG